MTTKTLKPARLVAGLAAVLATVFAAAGGTAARAEATPVAILPAPTSLSVEKGSYLLGPDTTIVTDAATRDTGKQLAEMLAPATGYTLKVGEATTGSRIEMALDPSLNTWGDEGYRLSIVPDHIVIKAAAPAGAFYAVQTLRQLLPPAVFKATKAEGVAWNIPCVTIEDHPRFGWRGMMIDSCRHFFTKAEILRFLDVMAMQKMNHFHWHLTDDQGWRIEIKRYPKLTDVSAWRRDIGFGFDPKASTCYDAQGRYGGYYTQEDIREVVAYAAARHIVVVPEIEMPGHCAAALAAFPELSCSGKPAGEYCPGNDADFVFLENVLTEVAGLFPGPYIHIGGDECNKGNWRKCPKCQARMKAEHLKNEEELQSYFVRRIEKIVNARGKRLLGWDEILEGGLAPGATVMSWRGVGGGITAARAGHDVVMAPGTHTYFDHAQGKVGEPKHMGGALLIDNVYKFDPVVAGLDDAAAHHVLGVQGQLWSEYIPNFQHLQYMAWPRGCALAEVGWSDPKGRNWAEFSPRLKVHLERLAAMGANFHPLDTIAKETVLGRWKTGDVTQTFAPHEFDITQYIKKNGPYAITFQYTDGDCRLDIEWMEILADGKVVARDAHIGRTGTHDTKNVYTVNLDAIKPGAHYVLRASMRTDGGTDSNGEITLATKPN